jgi:beta-galactosidase
VPAAAEVPAGVEAVRRHGDGASWLFLLNHTDAAVEVPVTGVVVCGRPPGGFVDRVSVAAGAVVVVREEGR